MSLLNNIANYLLSSKESPKSAKQFVPWSQLSKVLILAHDNQLNNVVDFINACQKDTIQVHVAVIYDGKPEQTPKPNFDHSILDKKQFNFFGIPNQGAIETLNSKQFNFFGIPNQGAIETLNSKQFDTLINLGDAEQIKSLAISKLVSAKCKISHFQNPIFDISIDGDKKTNSSKFLDQVILYLHMIKTTHK